MAKVLFCPCCGWDFRNKNWVKESEILFKKYDNKTYNLIKRVINTCGKYEKITPEDVYKFLKGLSIAEEKVVFNGLKSFLNTEFYHTKGLSYAKGIVLNYEKNKDIIIKRQEKVIGAKSRKLEDE